MNARIDRIEALLAEADPAAVELVQELLALYGEGLGRIMATVGEAEATGLAADELVSSLLLLHDLHPLDTRARVRSALAGTSAAVVAIEDDLVRLRVPPTGCASSAAAATTALREAVLDAAPEIARVEIDQTPVIPVESLVVRRGSEAP
ncbi:hypothetical protein ACFOY2_03360 [Nonomuraea purpurea]|uniref:NifU family protein n=1 Tax=Nonomuraea purpurea TaxID=1849276 RepID=A0ABV8FWX3_9ACTN